MDLVGEAFDEAFEIIYSEDGWKEEKKNDKGDVVVSKKSKKGQKNPHHFLLLLFQANLLIFRDFEKKSHTIPRFFSSSGQSFWRDSIAQSQNVHLL